MLLRISVALMSKPHGRHYGYELAKQTGMASAVVYPVLSRLLEDGWLVDDWEEQWEGRKKRPPRRYYELTNLGRRELGALATDAATDPRLGGLWTV
jgi:PadR family transcriptional regulator PadR